MKLYKIKLSLITASFLCLSISSETHAQCNANISICTSGINGPYAFSNPGTAVSTCLDFWGPSYAYINLYITGSGPLELLINGDANNGYLDVSIFNIHITASVADSTLFPANADNIDNESAKLLFDISSKLTANMVPPPIRGFTSMNFKLLFESSFICIHDGPTNPSSSAKSIQIFCM